MLHHKMSFLCRLLIYRQDSVYMLRLMLIYNLVDMVYMILNRLLTVDPQDNLYI